MTRSDLDQLFRSIASLSRKVLSVAPSMVDPSLLGLCGWLWLGLSRVGASMVDPSRLGLSGRSRLGLSRVGASMVDPSRLGLSGRSRLGGVVDLGVLCW